MAEEINETKEKVETLDLRECVKPSFDVFVDSIIQNIPQDKLFSQLTGYTIKNLLKNNLICGSWETTTIAFKEREGWVKYMLDYRIPAITEYYNEHGMGCILEIKDGDWNVYFCVIHKDSTKQNFEYNYMKCMGKPHDLKAAYNDWSENFFKVEKEKEHEEYRKNHKYDEDPVEEPVEEKKPGFFARLFGKK